MKRLVSREKGNHHLIIDYQGLLRKGFKIYVNNIREDKIKIKRKIHSSLNADVGAKDLTK